MNCAREESLIKRLRSKIASILSKAFFTQITESLSSDALKHIIGMSKKRSTPAPETVTVRKNNFVSPPPPVSPLGLFKSFVDLIFLGSIYSLFLALRQCQFSFLYLNNFSTNRLVIAQLSKMSVSMRKV